MVLYIEKIADARKRHISIFIMGKRSNRLQYSSLGNSMDRAASWATSPWITKLDMTETRAKLYFFIISQPIFTALKVLCISELTPLLPCTYFPCLHSFVFSRMSYIWNHLVCSLHLRLASFIVICIKFLYVFPCLDISFYYWILFHCLIYSSFSLYIHLLENIWLPQFDYYNKVTVKHQCADFCVDINCQLLWVNIETQLLDHVVRGCLVLWNG